MLVLLLYEPSGVQLWKSSIEISKDVLMFLRSQPIGSQLFESLVPHFCCGVLYCECLNNCPL